MGLLHKSKISHVESKRRMFVVCVVVYPRCDRTPDLKSMASDPFSLSLPPPLQVHPSRDLRPAARCVHIAPTGESYLTTTMSPSLSDRRVALDRYVRVIMLVTRSHPVHVHFACFNAHARLSMTQQVGVQEPCPSSYSYFLPSSSLLLPILLLCSSSACSCSCSS